MGLPDLISTLALLLILGLPVIGIVWGLFQAVSGLLANARKHEPPTSLDCPLPLRGRWLRYAFAALLIIVGGLAVAILVSIGFFCMSLIFSRGARWK